jgi:hypothetical protein
LLQRGNFAAGWDEYTWRSKAASTARLRPVSLRHWDGAALDGRTVFVQPEAALEDEILFASCLPDLIGRARRVVLACDPRLTSLLSRSFPTAIVHSRDAAAGTAAVKVSNACDVQIAAGDLPRSFRRTEAKFPQRASYLAADQAQTEHWQHRFSDLGDGLKVGLVWKPEGLPATSRAPAWQQWRGVLNVPGVQFIGLPAAAQPAAFAAAQSQWGVAIHSCGPIDGLDDLAARMAALDLVITVDDPAAHLAGALGTPVWTLLSYAWGWRWMLARDSAPSYGSLWYPNMRLFRPRRPSAWPEMMTRVRQALVELAADRAADCREVRRDLPHGLNAPRQGQAAPHRGELAWP